MRAGVETIRIMEEDGLLHNAATVGAHLQAALRAALGSLSGVPGTESLQSVFR